jgi:hypothetical protein
LVLTHDFFFQRPQLLFETIHGHLLYQALLLLLLLSVLQRLSLLSVWSPYVAPTSIPCYSSTIEMYNYGF